MKTEKYNQESFENQFSQIWIPKAVQIRTCRNCDKSIDNKHINAKFCKQKCKDNYHNRTNPRGIFGYKKPKSY